MQVPDIRLDGHSYDVRVLAGPAEYLALLAATRRRPGTGGPVGLEAVLQQDLEHVVDSRAAGVHQAVVERAGSTACSCGLVMPAGLDVVTTTGHRDLDTWRPATSAYVVGEHRGDPARFGATCPDCLWCHPAEDLAGACDAARAHECGPPREPADAVALRRHLRLA